MKTDPPLIAAVANIYKWIDAQITAAGQTCDACGKCCDFDTFDHRLFVTTPELIYFASAMAPAPIKPMPTGTCPYNTQGKCSVYPHRFAACRIFACKGNPDFQSKLSENAIKKLKALCEQHAINYEYKQIKTALNHLCDNTTS